MVSEQFDPDEGSNRAGCGNDDQCHEGKGVSEAHDSAFFLRGLAGAFGLPMGRMSSFLYGLRS